MDAGSEGRSASATAAGTVLVCRGRVDPACPDRAEDTSLGVPHTACLDIRSLRERLDIHPADHSLGRRTVDTARMGGMVVVDRSWDAAAGVEADQVLAQLAGEDVEPRQCNLVSTGVNTAIQGPGV